MTTEATHTLVFNDPITGAVRYEPCDNFKQARAIARMLNLDAFEILDAQDRQVWVEYPRMERL